MDTNGEVTDAPQAVENPTTGMPPLPLWLMGII